MKKVFLGLLLAACSTPRPQGNSGPEADSLAQKMIGAVGGEAWQNTGAVQWNFADKNHHLWDKKRHYAQVKWDDTRALIDINNNRGRAWQGDQELTQDAAKEVLDDAHARWTNDAFWLNPVVKAFDPGTTRQKIVAPEGTGVMVVYESGGRTPGDAYLWWLAEDGTPTAWQMWTSNLPKGGIKASWTRWVTLDTGAKISTLHETSLFDLEIKEVKGAPELSGLASPDPFAPLAACPQACTAY